MEAVTISVLLLALSVQGFGVAVAQNGGPSTMTAPEGYTLGDNDEIEVTLFGQPQNTVVRTRIKEDGTIVMPYIGQVVARGRTARQLSTEIASRLESGGFYTKPVVSVDVTQYVSNSVTVAGAVGQPGVFPLDNNQTLQMAIARAGGPRTDGADYVLLSRKSDATPHRILLADLSGEWSGSTRMMPGDSLYVPAAPIMYVYGQINQPGQVPIKTGMTVRQALARAGGPTLAGSEHKLTIYRAGKKLKKIDLESLVQPGDTLFVHERLL